ncbi:hypothetical protein ACF06P_38820 [Streptomyces sp. NPDC015684]|uniref:hypothetical protein n=1 Tax=unclassified Streptomyces TaxID=2593676 RepID=UPI0037027D20
MAFGMFPKDQEQLRLPPGATTGLVEFTVPKTAGKMFLRILAVGSGTEALGGAPPTIQLRAGSGIIVTVPEEPAERVSIRDENAETVAAASWIREANDVFKVSVIISKKAERTWRLRITNDDPEEQGFVWVTSTDEAETLQPRISPAGKQRSFGTRAVYNEPLPAITVIVANIGTGDLRITDPPDTDLGGGFTLKARPNRIQPNHADSLIFKAQPVAFGTPEEELRTEYVIGAASDSTADERTITLSRVGFPKPSPPPENPKPHKDRKDTKDAKDDEIEKGHGAPPEYTGVVGPVDVDSLFGVGEESMTRQIVNLEKTFATLAHFIPPKLRPDLSANLLAREREDEAGRSASGADDGQRKRR